MEEQKNHPDPHDVIETAKKHIELGYYQLKEALIFPGDKTGTVLANDLISAVEQFKNDVIKASQPTDIFKHALSALDNLDKKNFVIENLLEGLKRNEAPATLLHRFDKLGLLNLGEEYNTIPDAIEEGTGSSLQLIKSGIRKAQILGTSLLSATVKALPKLAKFEHKVTFGKNGLMPEISFGVGSDVGLTLQDILTAVGDELWLESLRQKQKNTERRQSVEKPQETNAQTETSESTNISAGDEKKGTGKEKSKTSKDEDKGGAQ